MPECLALKELQVRIREAAAHYGGVLPTAASIAWHGYIAALLEWGLISVGDHKAATDLLPPITDDSVLGLFLGFENLRGIEPGLEIGSPLARFNRLAEQWKTETRFLSNVNTKSMHVAYQKIIGLGPVAVPLMIEDLEKNGPGDWFWALHVITGANPITENIAGNMKAMTEAWISWWKNANRPPDFLTKTNSVSQASV
jgi:hypothetical protein